MADRSGALATPGIGRAAQTSAGVSVYEALRQQIVQLDLPPDTTLSRAELARRFGVSQTPLREAMGELERDGLIHVFPQSRTVVTRIDVKQLHENHFLRLSVELEVVRRLAETPQADAVRRAAALLDMQATLLGQPDRMDMFDDLDRAFHRALFEGVGMERIHALVLRRQGHLARCQRLELPKKGRGETIVAAHGEIVSALQAGDPEAAALAMRAHLSGTISRIGTLRGEFPDFFTETR